MINFIKNFSKSKIYIPTIILTSCLIGFALFAFSSRVALIVISLVFGLILALIVIHEPFVGLLIYMFLEYGRLQDQFPALAPLKLSKVVAIIVAIAWVLQSISRGRYHIPRNKQSWAFLGFLFVMGLSVVTAVNNFYAFHYFRGMCITFVGYFLLINLVDSITRFRKFLWFFLIVHAFLAIKGIHNYTIMLKANPQGYRAAGFAAGGFVGDENDFAMLLNAVIPYAYFLSFGAKSSLQKVISLMLLMLFVAAVVLSFSRGGFVGLAVVLGYCLLRSPRKRHGMVLAVALITTMILIAPLGYWHEVRSIKDATSEEDTGRARIESWKSAFRMFKDHPIIGVGASNFRVRFPEYQTDYFPRGMYGRAAHGTFPELLAELGICGTFFFLWMLYLNARDLWQIKRMTKARRDTTYYIAEGVTVNMIGYLVSAIFLSTLYYPHFWMLSALTVALKNATMKHLANEKHDAQGSIVDSTYTESDAISAPV